MLQFERIYLHAQAEIKSTRHAAYICAEAPLVSVGHWCMCKLRIDLVQNLERLLLFKQGTVFF